MSNNERNNNSFDNKYHTEREWLNNEIKDIQKMGDDIKNGDFKLSNKI